MTRIRPRRRRSLAAGLITIIALGGGTALAYVFRANGLSAAGNWAQIISIPVALAPLISPWRAWWRSHATSVRTGTPEQLENARRALAGLVLGQWREEILIRQLDDPAPLAVRWKLTSLAVMDHAEHIGPRLGPLARLLQGGRLQFEGRTDEVGDIARKFRSLQRKRLIILGQPGMGKTTLAVLLLNQLLTSPGNDSDPVPVLFSMSSWHPLKESLNDWMTRWLSESYPVLGADDFGPDAPRDLVAQSRILPIFDGMDELPPEIRPVALARINASFTATEPYILTCRTEEYENAVHASDGDVLTGAAVIVADALIAGDAAHYVTRCLPPDPGGAWPELLNILRTQENAPITLALDSPLALWLLRKVFIESRNDPGELLDRRRFPDAASIVDVLFDRLVESLITANPANSHGDDKHPFRPRSSWQPDKAKRWLSFIAAHLDQLQTRDIAWWQLRYAMPNGSLKFVLPVLMMTGGLGFGLAASVGLGLSATATAGMAGGLTASFGLSLLIRQDLATVRTPITKFIEVAIIGLLIGVSGGALIGLFAGASAATAFCLALLLGLVAGSEASSLAFEPVYANFHLPGRVYRLLIQLARGVPYGLAAGVVLGITAGVPVAFARGSAEGRSTGLWFGLIAGLGLGVAGGFTDWATRPMTEDRPQTPAVALRRDITLVLVRSVAFGMVFGIAFGFINDLMAGLVAGLLITVSAAVVGGPIYRAGGMYLLTTTVLSMQGRVPARLMHFLADAHRLGLLRRVGPIYQFRHARLQDDLSRRGAPDDPGQQNP